MTTNPYEATDAALATGAMEFVDDKEYQHWLEKQRIKHTDLYQTFMNLNTDEVTQDHFVETVVGAALSYGFHAGVTFHTMTTTTTEQRT